MRIKRSDEITVRVYDRNKRCILYFVDSGFRNISNVIAVANEKIGSTPTKKPLTYELSRISAGDRNIYNNVGLKIG